MSRAAHTAHRGPGEESTSLPPSPHHFTASDTLVLLCACSASPTEPTSVSRPLEDLPDTPPTWPQTLLSSCTGIPTREAPPSNGVNRVDQRLEAGPTTPCWISTASDAQPPPNPSTRPPTLRRFVTDAGMEDVQLVEVDILAKAHKAPDYLTVSCVHHPALTLRSSTSTPPPTAWATAVPVSLRRAALARSQSLATPHAWASATGLGAPSTSQPWALQYGAPRRR